MSASEKTPEPRKESTPTPPLTLVQHMGGCPSELRSTKVTPWLLCALQVFPDPDSHAEGEHWHWPAQSAPGREVRRPGGKQQRTTLMPNTGPY